MSIYDTPPPASPSAACALLSRLTVAAAAREARWLAVLADVRRRLEILEATPPEARLTELVRDGQLHELAHVLVLLERAADGEVRS